MEITSIARACEKVFLRKCGRGLKVKNQVKPVGCRDGGHHTGLVGAGYSELVVQGLWDETAAL